LNGKSIFYQAKEEVSNLLIISDPNNEVVTFANPKGDQEKSFYIESSYSSHISDVSSRLINVGDVECTIYFLELEEKDSERTGIQLSDVEYYRGIIIIDVDNEQYRYVAKKLQHTFVTDESLAEEYYTLVNEDFIEIEIFEGDVN